jgi:hypothetical protein
MALTAHDAALTATHAWTRTTCQPQATGITWHHTTLSTTVQACLCMNRDQERSFPMYASHQTARDQTECFFSVLHPQAPPPGDCPFAALADSIASSSAVPHRKTRRRQLQAGQLHTTPLPTGQRAVTWLPAHPRLLAPKRSCQGCVAPPTQLPHLHLASHRWHCCCQGQRRSRQLWWRRATGLPPRTPQCPPGNCVSPWVQVW